MTNKPIKLLISTDSPIVHTGLAETTRLVFRKLLEKYPGKYEIEQIGWFHFGNHPNQENVPWKVHPTSAKDGKLDMSDKYGQRSFESVRGGFKPDIVYTNGDIWCFEHVLNSPTRNTFRMAAYHTIDGEPYYGRNLKKGKSSEWGEKLSKADRLVVLTETGKDVLQNSCPELKKKHIDVVYHPSDIDRFTPLSLEEVSEARKKLYAPGIPTDAFIMGWIGRNQYRKQNYKLWETMHHIVHGDYIECLDCKRITRYEIDRSTGKPRAKGKIRLYDPDYSYDHCWHCLSENVQPGTPLDDVYLWTHMNKTDPGWAIGDLSEQWEVVNKIISPENITQAFGLKPEELASLIATWDCMLSLSGGEGFGIPPYEALACGVPVIYSNYSAHADFCQHGGLPVRVDLIPEINFSINRAYADVNHAIEQVLVAYRDRDALKALGMNGRNFCETKSIDFTAQQWDKIFTEMMKQEVGSNNSDKIYADIL